MPSNNAFQSPAEYQRTLDELRGFLVKEFATTPAALKAKDRDDLVRLGIRPKSTSQPTRLQVVVALREAKLVFKGGR
jgi:hypothetical protein